MDATERLRGLFHETLVLQHFKHSGDHVLAEFPVLVLASAELKCEFDFVSFRQELAYLPELVLQVARVRARMELDFLDLRGLLCLALLLDRKSVV